MKHMNSDGDKYYEDYTLTELLDESDAGDLITETWLARCSCGACKEIMRRLRAYENIRKDKKKK